ncbi:SDR family NAD(P)-dependent oxidoreductase [Streptomyces sp. NBC_00234]|uniref:SDR family NAD(P)-dependent oxidoreductase n=1 Tax=Streptomyces sp. NBC_00234 TaxID=2903638 RepID=UPI002E2BCDB9|nr:SDR family NAD(P)-dependent oxidoreductase [Streptomyces sp. NBC_00234]
MEINGARVLVVGASGVIGGLLAEGLTHRGATVALAGRDRARLMEAARRCGSAHVRTFDACDGDACAGLPKWAADELGGLDAVVAAMGVVAFGRAEDVDDAVAEYLMTVNALAPAGIVRAALPLLGEGGAVVAVTGVVAEHPQAGMADYGAAKAALAAWLGALRRENRRGPVVLEARLAHLDTGFADRPVMGSAPALPPGGDLGRAVATVLEAIASGAALVRPGPEGSLVMEPRIR